MGLFVVAIALSAVSAYYSILGLALIFSASYWSVVILASILEVSKLVLASWLYRNWDKVNFLIKSYLTSAVIILMVITSVGTFGFLSQAHSQQDVLSAQTQVQLAHTQAQIESHQQQISNLDQSLAQLNRTIDIQLNANRAQGAQNTRRVQQAERVQLQQNRDQVQTELEQLNAQKLRLTELQIGQEAKLGPIRYVMALVNPDADPTQAVKWLILVLVMVCDPLAVLMVMASSTHRKQSEQPEIMPGTLRYLNSEWQSYTGDGWESVQGPGIQGTTDPATPASGGLDLKPLAELVDQVVTEVIRQRPIFEMANPHHSQPTTSSQPHTSIPQLDISQVQKLIENTLESWMNRTLTVTYTADQAEIDQIVEKVIARTAAARTEPAVEQPEVVQDATPPVMSESSTSVESSHVNRPIHNYFGEDRIRGGKKHNITT